GPAGSEHRRLDSLDQIVEVVDFLGGGHALLRVQKICPLKRKRGALSCAPFSISCRTNGLSTAGSESCFAPWKSWVSSRQRPMELRRSPRPTRFAVPRESCMRRSHL